MSIAVFMFLLVYLGLGFVVYRRSFPKGLFPKDADPERERLLRTGRRRVLPLPRIGGRR